MRAEKDIAFTNPEEVFTPKLIGSGQGPGVGGSIDSGFEAIITPGDNVVIEATNRSGQSLDVSIDLDYSEIPANEIEELDV